MRLIISIFKKIYDIYNPLSVDMGKRGYREIKGVRNVKGRFTLFELLIIGASTLSVLIVW